jgi:iron(III) transport system permease protein
MSRSGVAVLGFVWAALLVAVGWPLLRLALAFDASAWGALGEAATWAALANTVALTGAVTAVAVGAGVPLGILVGRTDVPGAATLRSLLLVPYLVPPYVMVIAWILLLNPATGWLNQLFGASFDLYGLLGMTMVMGFELTPLVVLATADAAVRLDPALEESARVAGASPWVVLRRVTLPLVAPSVAEAAGLVAAATAAAFGVPYLLASGGRDPAHVLTTRIYQALDLAPADGMPRALAMALLLLCFGLAAPALLRWGARRFAVPLVGGKGARPPTLTLGAWRWPALAAALVWVGVGGLLPLLTLVAASAMTSIGRGFVWDNLGIATWADVLSRSIVHEALGRSMLLAAGAATAATALGAALALVASRTTLPGRHAAMVVARAPYAVPGTVLALGLLLAWSQEIRFIFFDRVTLALALADTGWLLGLAYAVKWLAVPVGAAESGLAAVDRSLEEAARVSGAGPIGTLRRVTLPLIATNLLSAWLLVFLPAFGEVTASVLLTGPDTAVVGAVLFQLQSYGDPTAAAALGVVMAGFVLLGNGALRWVGGARRA